MNGIRRLFSGVFPVLAAALVLPSGALHAAPDGNRPRIALVLSGGGALGYAHIGVLQVLDRMRVPIDCVVGTSMGALVGGTFAAGIDPQYMQKVIVDTDVEALFNDQPPRADVSMRTKRDDYRPLFDFRLGFNGGEVELPASASAGYRIELFLKRLLGTGATQSNLDFDSLPTPYRAIATNLETGKMKIFEKGEITKVMRASMSLPAVVEPTQVDGDIYIDGGMVRNLPVDIGRELCGDLVIAVKLSTPLKSRHELRSSLDIARQSITMLIEQNEIRSLNDLTDRDIVIAPELEGFDASSFGMQREIIALGAEAAERVSGRLARLALPAPAYREWLAQRQQRKLHDGRITSLAARSTEEISDTAILMDTTAVGDGIDIETLNQDITRIFGRGDFSYTGYSIKPGKDGYEALIEAQRKPWGPGYLRLGLETATDFNSPTKFNFAASYLRTWINDLGAEFRMDAQVGTNSLLQAEYLQPLQFRDGLFVAGYAGAQRDIWEVYQADSRVGNVTSLDFRTGLDLGVTGAPGELRVGPYARHVRAENDFGIINDQIPEHSESDQLGLLLRGVYDQLDSAGFPREGVFASGSLMVTDADWGSDETFMRAQLSFSAAGSLGNNTVLGRLEWGDELSAGGNLALPDRFKLGGPGRLSGLFIDQLEGTRYSLASMRYYYRFADFPALLGRGMYLGVSGEAGNINDPLMSDTGEWVTGGSLFWGADTALGTVYAGFGVSSLDQNSFYLLFGPQFGEW